MSITVHKRQDWAARSARPMSSNPPVKEAFLHYTDEPGEYQQLSAIFKHMRELQNFHMDTRGWSDIAYHFVVFQPTGTRQRAIVCQGRLVKYVPAAQLNHNTATLAISVVANGSDQLERNTRYAIEQLLNNYPTLKTLGGHRDVTSTDCPGDHIYHAIPRIAEVCDLKVYDS